jgi:hypothetical protein
MIADVVECLLCDSLLSAEFGTRICSTCKEQNPTVVDPREFVKASWTASWFDPYPFTVITYAPGDKRFSCCSMSLPYHAQDCSNDPEYIAERFRIEGESKK